MILKSGRLLQVKKIAVRLQYVLEVWKSIRRFRLYSSFPFVALARDFVVINPIRLETGR